MKPWAHWIASFILLTYAVRGVAQGPGFVPPPPTPVPGSTFTPPMPTQVPGPFAPPIGGPGGGFPPAGAFPPGGGFPPSGMAGEPIPFGPSGVGAAMGPGPGGPGGSGTRQAGGLFPDRPPPEMLTLTNAPNSWDSDVPADAYPWSFYSSFTVDMLFLNSSFDRNPAYRSNVGVPGGRLLTRDFDTNDVQLTPRLNLDIRFRDVWGVRGSWMQFGRSAATEFIGNNNQNTTVISPPVVDGRINVLESDVITVGNTFFKNVQNNFIERSAGQIVSPRPYFFLDLVPTQSLQPPITNLPPFTLLNAVQSGFPDFFAFNYSFRTEVFDLDVTRYIEFNRSIGTLGLGLRYGYISHSYKAIRRNLNGSTIIPGYDPFITLIDDAEIFQDADNESVVYGHNFGGTGPKISFELGTEITRFARIYGKANASVLMGTRKEIAFYESLQSVRITDTTLQAGQQQSDIFYDRVANAQVVDQREIFTIVPVAEAEAGLEIAMGGRLFPVLRLGGFGQVWVNGGNATNPNANLFIYGVNASLGFGW